MRTELDPYIFRTLMRDLVGHDRKPACFLVYVWLAEQQSQAGEPVRVSYQRLAEATGLSRSATQSAVAWLRRRKLLHSHKEKTTATPCYRVLQPWRRRPGHPASVDQGREG